MDRPTSEWPQFVLTNMASFTGHTGLRGASGFLVRVPDGRVLGATAKHLIGPAGGVTPPVPLAELGGALKFWAMFPRTDRRRVVLMDQPAISVEHASTHDWLLMTLKNIEQLPAQPLVARETPVQVGETVYLVGVPYSEPQSAQNVYRGVVTAREREDSFRYALSPPVDLRGFSGAPLVDADGRVVGVMGIWFEPKTIDGKDAEGGAEDMATALRLLTGAAR